MESLTNLKFQTQEYQLEVPGMSTAYSLNKYIIFAFNIENKASIKPHRENQELIRNWVKNCL